VVPFAVPVVAPFVVLSQHVGAGAQHVAAGEQQQFDAGAEQLVCWQHCVWQDWVWQQLALPRLPLQQLRA